MKFIKNKHINKRDIPPSGKYIDFSDKYGGIWGIYVPPYNSDENTDEDEEYYSDSEMD
jgi:hypothetical protein